MTAKGPLGEATPDRDPGVLSLLQKCALYNACSQEGLEKLARTVKRKRFLSGEPIFHAGDPGGSMLGILTGSVRISVTERDGSTLILADFGPGDVLGEIAVLDGMGRSADATAVTNCEVALIDRTHVLELLHREPDFCTSLVQLLCRKIRQADERTTDLAFLDLRARLAKALLGRAKGTFGSSSLPKVSADQTELGRIAGGTRSNVNRQLKDWERAGVLRMEKGWIILVDHARLQNEAGIEFPVSLNQHL